MYDRILQSRRSGPPPADLNAKSLYSYVCEAVQETDPDDFTESNDHGFSHYTVGQPMFESERSTETVEDSEGIFELDF